MVPVIAEDLVIVAVFFAAALVICLQWLARGRLEQRAQAALQSMEEVRHLLDQAPLGLAILDCDLRYVFINRLLADINGIDAAAHVGKSLREIVPELTGEVEEPFRNVVRTGQPLLGLVLTGSTPAQPGVERTWRENVYPRRDRDGNVIGLAVSVEEITEQQILQARLQASETQQLRRTSELESLMDAVPAAVFIAHDRSCVNVSINPEGARLLRLQPGENPSISAPGRRPFEVRAHGVPVPAEALPLQRAAARGEQVRGEEYTVHFENGEQIHVTINAMPLHDEAGQVVGAVAAFVDTTAGARLAEGMRVEAARKEKELAAFVAAVREPLAAANARLKMLCAPEDQPTRAGALDEIGAQVELALRRVEDRMSPAR